MIGLMSYLICAVLIAALQYFTHQWWWIAVVPGVYFFIRNVDMVTAVFTGAMSSGSVWLFASLWLWLLGGSELIARRVAMAVQLQEPIAMVLLGSIIAIFVGGFSGAAGASIRLAIINRESRPDSDADSDAERTE